MTHADIPAGGILPKMEWRLPQFRKQKSAFAVVLSAFACLLVSIGVHAESIDERWTGGGSIAGKPATFILDTGVQQPYVIAATAAKRFGLQTAHLAPPDAVNFETISTPVPIVLPGGRSRQVSFAVLKEADTSGFGGDALIGWPVLRAEIAYFDRRRSLLAIGSSVPDRLVNAQSFPILPGNDLVFDAGTKGSPCTVFLDSGWSGGVMLSKPLWDEWRHQHQDLPYTYSSAFWYATGWVVLEQVLATEIRIGSLSLRNVLVSPLPEGLASQAAMIGLKAFTNHPLVIDGPGGSVRIAQPGTPIVTPSYNRLGATFGPNMTARVARNSPASAADIRDGDVLLGINGQAPEAYAATVNGHVWEQPAGTVVRLSLRRGSAAIDLPVTLRDFLSAK